MGRGGVSRPARLPHRPRTSGNHGEGGLGWPEAPDRERISAHSLVEAGGQGRARVWPAPRWLWVLAVASGRQQTCLTSLWSRAYNATLHFLPGVQTELGGTWHVQFILFSSLRDKCRVSFSVGKSLRKDTQAPDLDTAWPDPSTPGCGFSTGVTGEKTIACSLWCATS